MALEKKNPLPPGRYWIDVVTTEKIAKFSGLLNTAVALGVATIDNIELEGASVDLEALLAAIQGLSNPPSAWFLFTVHDAGAGTLSIDHETFGFPTIATANIHDKSDTVQKPDPVGEARNSFESMVSIIEGLAAVATLVTVLQFLGKLKSKVNR